MNKTPTPHIVGQTYGLLTVVTQYDRTVTCKCACGLSRSTTVSALLNKRVYSCGCTRRPCASGTKLGRPRLPAIAAGGLVGNLEVVRKAPICVELKGQHWYCRCIECNQLLLLSNNYLQTHKDTAYCLHTTDNEPFDLETFLSRLPGTQKHELTL